MKEKNKKLLAREWFKIGKEEFLFANGSFEDLDDFYTPICVQCHQAIEKYLKGFLVLKGVDIPYIHDLKRLLTLCIKEDSELKKFVTEVKDISDYYLFLRYPVHYEEKTKKEAADALEIAKKIIDYIDGSV